MMITERDEQLGQALRRLPVPRHRPAFFDELTERLEGAGAVPLPTARARMRAPAVWLAAVAAAMALLLGPTSLVDHRKSPPQFQVRGTSDGVSVPTGTQLSSPAGEQGGEPSPPGRESTFSRSGARRFSPSGGASRSTTDRPRSPALGAGRSSAGAPTGTGGDAGPSGPRPGGCASRESQETVDGAELASPPAGQSPDTGSASASNNTAASNSGATGAATASSAEGQVAASKTC